jgi:hypothetical protein
MNSPTFPPPEAFHSTLSNTEITIEQYEYCKSVWDAKNMTSFRDFLLWHNNLDVVPFLEAIENMSTFWKERSIDMFKDGVSVPGLTMKYLFSNVAAQNTTQKSISIVFSVSAIRHDSSLSKYRKQKQSPPWTFAILSISRGGLLLLTVLAE